MHIYIHIYIYIYIYIHTHIYKPMRQGGCTPTPKQFRTMPVKVWKFTIDPPNIQTRDSANS